MSKQKTETTLVEDDVVVVVVFVATAVTNFPFVPVCGMRVVGSGVAGAKELEMTSSREDSANVLVLWAEVTAARASATPGITRGGTMASGA